MNTGIKITEEERQQVEAAYNASGMLLSGGFPMGDPSALVAELCRKYDMKDCGLNLKTGEFVRL